MQDDTRDKRRHPRLMREETLSIRPLDVTVAAVDGQPLYCSTLDMSASGMRVQIDQALPEGTRVDIWIALLDDLGTYHLQGRINRLTTSGDGNLVAGIELLPESEDLRGWEELF